MRLRLRLESLNLRGGERHVAVFPMDIPPLTIGGSRYDVVVPDGVEVAVDRITGGYLVHLSLGAKVLGPCSRCLQEACLQVQAEQDEFIPTAVGDWDASESSPFIKDMVVDLSGVSREALVLALPDRMLCSEECKGLCPLCGHDLNDGVCGCKALEV